MITPLSLSPFKVQALLIVTILVKVYVPLRIPITPPVLTKLTALESVATTVSLLVPVLESEPEVETYMSAVKISKLTLLETILL